MAEDLKVKLDAQAKQVERAFENAKAQLQQLGEQRAQLDRQIGALREEQVRLQGEWRVLQKIQGDAPQVQTVDEAKATQKPKKTTVKKKKK